MRVLSYEQGLEPIRGDVMHIPQLSMLSHDKCGGANIIGEMVERGVTVVLDEYDIKVSPDSPTSVALYAGPCLAMMLVRAGADRPGEDVAPVHVQDGDVEPRMTRAQADAKKRAEELKRRQNVLIKEFEARAVLRELKEISLTVRGSAAHVIDQYIKGRIKTLEVRILELERSL